MKRNKLINLVIIFIAVIALSLSGYLYYKLDNLKNSSYGGDKEIKGLITKIGRLYLLPNDETPTVATVTDPEILKSKSFFTLAEVDDKVLIYSKFGKAILYRPSLNKIIEVVPVKIDSNESIQNKKIEENQENVKKTNNE